MQIRLGDANPDGNVSFEDFHSLTDTIRRERTREGGDFNCSGDGPFRDILVVANNLGFSRPDTSAMVILGVPEPPNFTLFSTIWCRSSLST